MRVAFMIFISVLLLVCVMAALINIEKRQTIKVPRRILAGGEQVRFKVSQRHANAIRSENIVIDTLNLAHWFNRRSKNKKLRLCDIIRTIEITAPVLRRKFPGRIVYVTKNREMAQTEAKVAQIRARYRTAARNQGVYVNVVEQGVTINKSGPHASLGRDDFYLIMLAHKYKCAVLSHDKFRDLSEMKAGHLAPFRVWIYSPTTFPGRDFVNPAAPEFRRLRRPATIEFAGVLPHL